MGDYFQSIVDPEATEAEAPSLSDRVLRWLVDEQIVVSKPTDCVLGNPSCGYAPGPAYVKATGGPDDWVLRLRTNGLMVVSTRTFFHNGENGFEPVCGECGNRTARKRGWWSDAANEWYIRAGPGMLACPACQVSRPVTEWKHDPPVGFGNLGFTFWNWPPLIEEFIAAVGKQLGHRVLHVEGML
jgi:hypothetical protein